MTTTYLFPSTLQGLADVSVSPGVAVDDYPLTYDHGLGKWVASNNIAGVTIRVGAGARSQAIGSTANSTGFGWIAQGPGAGWQTTTGYRWIAQGENAAYNTTVGHNWMAQGGSSAFNNTLGFNWMAQGVGAGNASTNSYSWLAQGVNAAFSNALGAEWIAQGVSAGAGNVNGNGWLAQGVSAGAGNVGGSGWLAQGRLAGVSNTTGSYWVAQGFEAGYFDTRSNVLNVANSRSKSLICGDFASNCIYFGNADPITSSANVPVPTAAVHAAASNTTRASLRIDAGVAPTSPFTGDVWMNVSDNSITLNFPLVNLQNSQVLTTRRTGWSAPTGTATRSTFATFAGQDISAAPTEAEVQAIDDHVKVLSERLKALIDDLTTHGLIGA